MAVGEYPDGEGRKFTGVIRDVFQRKHAQEALRTSEVPLRSVFEVAGMVIIVLFPEFKGARMEWRSGKGVRNW